jgi:hypothetical protein
VQCGPDSHRLEVLRGTFLPDSGIWSQKRVGSCSEGCSVVRLLHYNCAFVRWLGCPRLDFLLNIVTRGAGVRARERILFLPSVSSHRDNSR